MPAVHDHLHSGTNVIGWPSGDSSTSRQESYSYDSGDRLTKACMDDSCTRYYKYSYDGVGNRLSQKTELGTTRYTYDAANELTREITPGPDVVYAYDANGNETRKGTARYTYNLENEPTVLKKDGVKVASYVYTGDGLMEKKVATSGSIFYSWDMNASLPQLALERGSQQGAVLRAYSYGAGPLELTTPQGTRTYHEDSLGSVVGLTDTSGNEVASYRYSPYGQEWSSDESPPSVEADANPLRFTRQYLDSDSELYYLRAREYDSETGRFLEIDPLEAGAGDPSVGTYVYVDDQPTVMTDPSGECAESANELYGNGCGPGGWIKVAIPDRIRGVFDFRKACSNHDFCYGGYWGTPKPTCDLRFLGDMMKNCGKTNWWDLVPGVAYRHAYCSSAAAAYYSAVNTAGCWSYYKGQMKKCPYSNPGKFRKCKKYVINNSGPSCAYLLRITKP